MKSKYVMISGFAFNEASEMEKLKKYASDGWILEDIKGGLFYKLKKDKPQDIIYSLDYQSEANEEYFAIFKEAGWQLVVSLNNQIHIFSAQAGTKPIYSDCESEIDKYIRIKNKTARGTIHSLIIGIVLLSLLFISVIYSKPMFLIILGFFMVDICILIFNFMPYLAYKSRIKLMKKEGRCDNELINNKLCYKLYAFAGIIYLTLGILNLIEKKSFDIFHMVLGFAFIVFGAEHYKKVKEHFR